MATKEQIAANRKNAKKSTGPKSKAGKEKAKFNGLVHGLRAEEVVLPGEDPAEFTAFLGAWMADWKPRTMARAQLVEEAATAAWRKRRCVRSESARLSRRIRDTIAQWRAEEEREVDEAVRALDDDPAGAVEALGKTRAGVERMIALWEEIAGAATPDGWCDADAHHFRLISLLGLTPEDEEADEIREASWRLHLRNAPEGSVTPNQPAPLGDAAAEGVAAWLSDLAAFGIAELRESLAKLPDPAASWLRQAEAEAMLPTREDALLLRYESQRSREFHRALGDLTKMARSGVDLMAIEEADESEDEGLPTEAKSPEVLEKEGVEGDFSDEESVDASAGAASASPPTVAGPAETVAGVDPAGVAGPKRPRRCA